MNLDTAQTQQVISWIDQGQTVSDIQQRLSKEFGITMTYLETRFLLDDLKIRPKDPEPPATPAVPAPPLAPTPAEPPPAPGAVQVSVDKLTRPGALVSGKVTFSDGVSAEWHLDQTGRLGLGATQPGYRPSQEDLVTFQEELQTQLARLGL